MGNVSRDMMTIFSRGRHLPSLHRVPVLIWDVRAKPEPGPCEFMMPVILPHDLMAWIYQHHRDQFNLRVLGSRGGGAVARFWKDSIAEDDLVWQHPVLRDRSQLDMVVPWGVHGDGVPVTKAGAGSMSLEVVSSSSLLGVGNTLDTHWPFAVVPHPIVFKKRPRGSWTHEPLWRTYNWSMAALGTGRHPDTDEYGQPWLEDSPRALVAGDRICGGYKFALLSSRADLDWDCNALQLQHYASENPCFRCPCNREEIPWSDMRPTAAWRALSYTNANWVAPSCPFFAGRGVQMRTVAIDPAHTMDKGVTQQALGSLFHSVVFEKVLKPRGTIDQQVDALWLKIEEFDRIHKTPDRLTRITLSDFCDRKKPHKEYPVFNPGNMSKTRCMVPFAAHLCQEISTGSPRDQHRCCLFEALAGTYDIILHGPDHLPRHMSQQLKEHIDSFNSHFTWLANEAAARHVLQYNVTIKFHYLAHMGDDALYLNPRVGWTLSDEDYVGKVKEVCRFSVKGTPDKNLPESVLGKLLRILSVIYQSQANR